VAERLRRRYPEAWVEVYHWGRLTAATARRLRRHRGSGFDLVHLAGDPGQAAFARELILSAELAGPGGCLLVDGYDRRAGVGPVVDAFLDRFGRDWQSLYLPPDGDLLIARPGERQVLSVSEPPPGAGLGTGATGSYSTSWDSRVHP
jgi:hypothetical protein